jgi:hypothetical protein
MLGLLFGIAQGKMVEKATTNIFMSTTGKVEVGSATGWIMTTGVRFLGRDMRDGGVERVERNDGLRHDPLV